MSNLLLHRRLMALSSISDAGAISCVYNVTSTTSATKILGFSTGMLSLIRSMEIDGYAVDPVLSYTFATTGQHLVVLRIATVFDATDLFRGCSALQQVIFDLNTAINVKLYRTFEGCSSLKEIDWRTSSIFAENLYRLFYQCSAGVKVDVSKIALRPSGSAISTQYMFYEAKTDEIIFSEVDKMALYETFWSLRSRTSLIDLTKVKAITQIHQVFINAFQPTKLDFGYCDLSAVAVTTDTVIEYNYHTAGTTIMLGKPFRYTRWKSVINGFRGTFIYNLNYDYSDFIKANPYVTPQANEPVSKVLRIRFCTNDAWVVDPSAEFVINGVRGIYTSQGVWEFAMTADTYAYPIYHSGQEIGEAIVKDDVQQIAFGSNATVYKVIDFSTAESYDPDVIVANDGWAWEQYPTSTLFLGLKSKKIALGESTSVVINTGMAGDIILTLAQGSQTFYHYGRIYDSTGKELVNMYGRICQSGNIVGHVQSEDGLLTFTYDKTNTRASELGLDRMYIKKIEHYDWPALPA